MACRHAAWPWIAAKTGRPEEFPIFTDWWLGKPQHEDDVLLLYAMLDSVSCTGAYEFIITSRRHDGGGGRGGFVFPRAANILAADPQRKPLATIGVRAADQHVLVRRRIRNGNSMITARKSTTATACCCIWKAARRSGVRWTTAPRCATRVFPAEQHPGFRPVAARTAISTITRTCFIPTRMCPASGWHPHANWGEGRLHLVELSTQYEGMDNVVAFWEPAGKPAPLQPLQVRLHAEMDARDRPHALLQRRAGHPRGTGRARSAATPVCH